MDHPLDNPIWQALSGPHRHLAFGHGHALHYPRDISSCSAVAEPTLAAYRDLSIGAPVGLTRLIRAKNGGPPSGWRTISERPLLQMVASESDVPIPSLNGVEIMPIGMDDIDEILALIAATEPGPFAARTPMLGAYIGIRDPASGALIAMAGERFRAPGHVELSAVAVYPAHRGKGYAAALLATLARAAFAWDEVPFLHVLPDNPARKLYESLGFRVRASLHYTIWEFII